MPATVCDEKKKAYKEAFSKYDKNKDNKLSTSELRPLLKTLGRNPSEATLKQCMAEDKDKSGFLEFEEFVQLMAKIDAEIEKRLKDSFNNYDKDKSGLISLDELVAAYEDMGVDFTAEEVKAELDKVDKNSDGKLNFEEFKKLFGRI